MLLTVSKIMRQMVAMILEGIVVFVLYFPSRSPRQYYRFYIRDGNDMVGHKRITIGGFTRRIDYRYLTPIHP